MMIRWKQGQVRLFLTMLQFAMIVMWAAHFVYTDSYFSNYALCCGLAAICLYDNHIHARTPKGLPLFLGVSIAVLLSLAATLANYPIFQRLRNISEVSAGTNAFLNLFEAGLTFVCGIVVFCQIFLCLSSRFPRTCNEDTLTTGKRPKRIFAGTFLCLAAIYLIYLFLVVYPGSVTSDSIWQLNQITSNRHTNHHPYWHTMSIKLLMSVGYSLFGSANAAAATFSAVQSIAMAAAFAYTVTTLYQYRMPRFWVLLAFAMFAFLPNHITYSCTMWKDVPFGLTVLVLVVAMFRIMRGVGKSRSLNFVMLLVGGIGSCILRSNGLAAMAAALLVLGLFFRKRCRELLIPWVAMVLVGWILTGPAMDWCGVKKNNFIEGLSVPLQQVARVITEGYELTAEEIRLIDTILDIEQVPEEYTQECVDPIKDMIREKNYDYLQENKGAFLKLWIDIGLRYPWEYVEAWVEETKGYWNSGYDYYIYAQYVSENNYGIYMVEQTNLIHRLVKAYFTLTRETVFFEPLQSIGFNVWVLSMLCFLNLLYNRKEFLLTVPVLAVVFTLWLTTPVFSEFRYAYSVFTTLPFLLPVSLYRRADEDR